MAPKNSTTAEAENTYLTKTSTNGRNTERPPLQIAWLNVYLITALHGMALYGLYILPRTKPWTWVWMGVCFILGGTGITIGAHRLWSHRSFKATWSLRLFLMLMNCMSAQNDIFEWVRDHRVHHKYSETDADPHNAKRGFFFSHVGWLMVRKHPDVRTKGKQIDMSDLYADNIVMFQRRHYKPLTIIFNIILPTLVPWYFWNEALWNSFFVCFAFRYAYSLNVTWSVNSFAHIWGSRPYDETISPSQNLVANLGTLGEGYHNFHHCFPQDYATSELGTYINLSKFFIDFFALVGLAYDLKTASKEAVFQRRRRTGDLRNQKH